MSDCNPIPVSDARQLAEIYDKDIVVIVAFDRSKNMGHTTTYGVSMGDKYAAAQLGDLVAASAFGPKGKTFEDFRIGRPKIICLCGSTRFKAAFESANEQLTLAGCIVLAPGCFSRSTPAEADAGIFAGCTAEQKAWLDELHKRKIDLCDEVLVLNFGGYIGESTRSEIGYAWTGGKVIKWLEPRMCRGCKATGESVEVWVEPDLCLACCQKVNAGGAA